MPDPTDIGNLEPCKKSRFGTYVIGGAIALIVILALVMFASGGSNSGNGSGDSPGGTSPSTPVTIVQLQSSIDSLNAQLSGLSGRIANLESVVSGLSAPSVTRADIDNLQSSLNALTARIDALEADTTSLNISGGSTYWLEGDDDDIRLHILSAKDMRFVAEVTVSYDDPTTFSNTTYDIALSDFYKKVGTDRDYLPNLIPYNTIFHNTTICSDYTLNLTEPNTPASYTIPFCYNTTVTLSDWKYTVVTFHTDSFKVTANEEKSGWIDGLNELGDYDTISVRLLPSLEASETGDGDWF